ncbi:hypothetical protein BDN71DRAFT_1502237 [Pleurotus eryngii]|uniref:Uncharacterized protein n=1 Tax=Pleurotus eryngii TaxID=5323 RepID=A0A9P6A7C6_PLEER|nr:hypothetical protein BDN71DRAFT_1502237 [Pleurotus eryngii]
MLRLLPGGMSGVHAVRWLSANSPSLSDMDWDVYKVHMRALFLPSDWEHTTRMDVLRIQQGSRSFVDFSLDLMGKNNLLASTDSFFNDDLVWDILEANMDQELAHELNHDNTNSIMGFRDWLDKVKQIDKHQHLHLKEIEDTIARISLRSTATCNTGCPSFTSCTNATIPLVGSTTFTLIPKLLPEERALLTANGRCYKCCKFWAGHVSAHCTEPPIDATKYKTLTQHDILPHPANFSAHTLSCASIAANVAAVTQATSRVSDIVEDSAGPDLATVASGPAVAAVLPNVSSWINSGSWSDDECTPFSCSNNFWHCLMCNTHIVPTPSLNALIDDSSAVVLIRDDLVDTLRLKRHVTS